MSDVAHETAADVVADLVDDNAAVAAADEAVEQSAPDDTAYELPSFDADTSGIEDILGEPEPDDEAGPVYTEYSEPDDEAETWDDDDEKRKLKSELAKAQKRLVWEQEQRVKASEKTWRSEASKRFPLADVDEIHATSRRAFLKAAAQQHQRYASKLKPVTEALDALKRQAVEEVKQEARAQAEVAWGKPTSGPQAPMVEKASDDALLDRRNHPTLYARTLARIKSGDLQI